MRAIRLKTEHMVNPLGLQTANPTLSWNCADGITQTAYQIIAKSKNRIVWDSGKVASSQMSVEYGGSAAGARERIDWSVTLWDENGEPGQPESAWFEMGLMDGSWEAKWIDPELPHEEKTRQPASVLRKTFFTDTTENARLYITCHGMYKARINGKPAHSFVYAPGTDDYRKRLQYQVYDVTELLKSGENEIAVTLGDGWYRGNNGVDGLYNYYGSDLALLCQLEVSGKPVLMSDETWQASQSGPVRLNDMEKGETYDARMEAITNWHGVSVKDYGFDKLVCSNSVPILEQERFLGRIFKTPNGETVVDFGQNLAGYTELKVYGKAGQKITLWHGETLDENGNFTQSNFDPGERNKNGGIPQRVDYICKDGLNVYKPSFSYFGFRYAKVESDVDLTDAEFTAIAVYSEMPQTGFFTCDNEDVNRLFLNSLWSMRSNFCDIPTDCPTRERAGWTGDAGAFAPTGVYLADCYPILRKWLAECRLAQGADGLVANIAPVNNSGSFISNMLQGSSGWGDASILVPWALYEAYGDKRILEENYEMMTKWLSFVEARAQKTRIQNLRNPYKKYLVDEGFHFGEWLEPDVSSMDTMKKNMMFGAPEVATAYYYKSAGLVARIADILGKTEDSRRYKGIAEGARNAYRYTCTQNGVITSKRQAEYVRPIAFGLLNEAESQAAADQLAKMVSDNNYHLNTGFLATPFLCRVLSDYGHTDTAYRLLLQDTAPSWLYPVKHGATTIWESWDGVREDGTVHDSLNHYAYGAISGWLMGDV
ncbi:MAG: family 78 glycoside hydrolase catalytic domain, partial [Clostridiales bacterium]|nr:family 78 glycoside hydrolase catalytic domain [Clostridiales bacterium]